MSVRENNLANSVALIVIAAVTAMPAVAANVRLECDVAVVGGGSAGFAAAWSAAKLEALLESAGAGGKTLEEWLRKDFFLQHSKL